MMKKKLFGTIVMLALLACMVTGLTGCPAITTVDLSVYDAANKPVADQNGPIAMGETAYVPGYSVATFSGAKFAPDTDKHKSGVSYLFLNDKGELETQFQALKPQNGEKTWECNTDLAPYLITAVIGGVSILASAILGNEGDDSFKIVTLMGPRVLSANIVVWIGKDDAFSWNQTGDGAFVTPTECGGGELRIEKDSAGVWLLKVGIEKLGSLACGFISTDSNTRADLPDEGTVIGAFINVNDRFKTFLDPKDILDVRDGMATWNLSDVFETIPESFNVWIWVENTAYPDTEDPNGMWWADINSFSLTGPVKLEDNDTTGPVWVVTIPGTTNPTTFTLNVSASPSNGGMVTGTGTYNSGVTANVTATANSGYVFTGWSGDANGTSNSATVNMSGNKNVVANFTAIGTNPTTFTLNVSASPSNGGMVTGTGTYNSGVTANVTATANSGYTFMYWTGDMSGSNNPTTITMSSNKTLTAVFQATNTGSTIALAIVGTTATMYPGNIAWTDNNGNPVSGTPTKVGFWRWYPWDLGYHQNPWDAKTPLMSVSGESVSFQDANVFETSRLTYDGHVIIKGNVYGEMANGQVVYGDLGKTTGAYTYGGNTFPVVGNALQVQVK